MNALITPESFAEFDTCKAETFTESMVIALSESALAERYVREWLATP
ncbi:MAG: hypothetical protein ABW080_04640 [Candidatus Thiodiazotropha sp.]